jgi:hypothetical protein
VGWQILRMTTAQCSDPFRTLLIRTCVLSIIALCCTCRPANGATTGQRTLATQKFSCHFGYDPRACELRIAELKTVLIQYRVAPPKHWSWIIVRSEDWQPLLRDLRLDRRTPAFTALTERETFLEDALFFPQPGRTEQLVRDLHSSFNQLLSFSVMHELGHAICHGGSEALANRVAEQLRSGKPVDCEEKSLSPIDELYLRSQRDSPLRR